MSLNSLSEKSGVLTIWNSKRTKYSDKDLLHIRDWLYTIAEVTVNIVDDYTKKDKLNELRDMVVAAKKRRGCVNSPENSTI